MGHEDSPLMRVCVCSHTVRRHEEDGGPCKAAGCGCGQVRVARAKNDQAAPPAAPAAVFTVGEQGPEPLAELEPLLSKPGRVEVADFGALKIELSATHPDGEPAEPHWIGAVIDAPAPVDTPMVEVQARVVPADDARWLIDRGLASPIKSTRDLAGDVQDGLDRLRRIVEEEAVARVAERAQVAERMVELEAELEAARRAFAELGGVLAAVAEPVAETAGEPVAGHRCPECGEVKQSATGLGGHRFHKHGVRKGDRPA
jgi:hypothetical protein